MSRELLKEIDGFLAAGISDNIDALKEKIKAELAKPEPEPIAWMTVDRSENRRVAMVGLSEKTLDEYELKQVPLYTSPPQQKPLTPSDVCNDTPWQPMETAPTDGTRLLVKSKEIGRCVASAATDIYGKTLWGVVNDVYVTPTAWLPLPEHK